MSDVSSPSQTRVQVLYFSDQNLSIDSTFVALHFSSAVPCPEIWRSTCVCPFIDSISTCPLLIMVFRIGTRRQHNATTCAQLVIVGESMSTHLLESLWQRYLLGYQEVRWGAILWLQSRGQIRGTPLNGNCQRVITLGEELHLSWGLHMLSCC